MATGREVCGYKHTACGSVRARTIPSTVDKRMEPDDAHQLLPNSRLHRSRRNAAGGRMSICVRRPGEPWR